MRALFDCDIPQDEPLTMRETLKRDHGDWVCAVTPVGEGDGVLSGGADKTIKLWKGGTLVHTHTGHTNTVTSIVMVGERREA